MATAQYEDFTMVQYTNADSPQTISSANGFRMVAISVSSSSTGNLTITSMGGSGITMTAGETLTLGTGNSIVNNITLTIASGCTVKVVGLKRISVDPYN